MKKRILAGTLLTPLLIGMLTLTFNIQPAEAEHTTWYVDDDGGADFTKIQDAIDAAEPGDTIYVYNGTYYENVIVNENNLTLVGENKHSTIIDGNNIGIVVHITANDVSVAGFTMRRSGHGDWPPWDSGVCLGSTSGCNIGENIITDNKAGIVLLHSSYNNVTANTAISQTYNGIVLFDSNNNLVSGNIASRNTYGISLSDSSDSNTVDGNTASENTYGISFWYSSDGNRVTCNNVSNNDNGIYLFDSNINLIFHNNFINNTIQAYSEESMNVWDNSYPSCGNYWNDYVDQDFFIGAGQDQPGSDGVWDHPYVIDNHNKDSYPLVSPWTPSWIPPWMPPGMFADLIRRKAWPEHHHYVISRHEDAGQTLHAKVKNLGNQTVWVKAIFQITEEGGSTRAIETEPLMIAQEEMAELSAELSHLTEQDAGKYSVSAFCWYSHNRIVWAQGEKTKTFSFTVVA